MIDREDVDVLERRWGKPRVLHAMTTLEHAVDHKGVAQPIEVTPDSVNKLLEAMFMKSIVLTLSPLGHMREARAMLSEINDGPDRSRELSVAITELDTAILWANHDALIKAPVINLKEASA